MRRVALMLSVLALAGCERGCLMRWMNERSGDGVGEGRGVDPSSSAPAGGFELTGTDCSDGLLRCSAGTVEASRVAHLSATCRKGPIPEKSGSPCACPWDVVEHCASGCADESVEVMSLAGDAGARQLCRPTTPIARPVLAADDASIDICADDGITCRDGIVRACDAAGAAARPLARCLFGCAPGVAIDVEGDGPTKNPAGLIAILCQRSDAERK